MNLADFCAYCLSLPHVEETTPFGPDVLVYKVGGKMFALATPDAQTATRRGELLKRLRSAAVRAERRELIRLWRENEISDEVMHHLEEVLDYQEAHP